MTVREEEGGGGNTDSIMGVEDSLCVLSIGCKNQSFFFFISAPQCMCKSSLAG